MSSNFKQIYFNELSGKLSIIDSQNNFCECNVYGEKKPHFLNGVTGTNKNERTHLSKNYNLQGEFYNPQTSKLINLMIKVNLKGIVNSLAQFLSLFLIVKFLPKKKQSYQILFKTIDFLLRKISIYLL
jgi:hypothetical protein